MLENGHLGSLEMPWGTEHVCTQVANATQNLGEPHSSPAPNGGYPTVLKTAPNTYVGTILPCRALKIHALS